jgi:hypothetical protein
LRRLAALLLASFLGAAVAADAPASARETATRVVRSLAAGDLEGVAALSNAPQRRLEVLQEYRARVGEEEFRRVFARYLEQPIVDEIALGRHRLVIWQLADVDGHLAGQYYVEVEGRFLLDDVPSDARARLRRVLEDYRKARPSGRKD